MRLPIGKGFHIGIVFVKRQANPRSHVTQVLSFSAGRQEESRDTPAGLSGSCMHIHDQSRDSVDFSGRCLYNRRKNRGIQTWRQEPGKVPQSGR